jgi:Arc/MetJ-type ribon-helix-helix transcriptional regulator
MMRTTITLPDELGSAVRREARRRNTSVSEVIRQALAEKLDLAGPGPRTIPFAAVGRSGHRTTARDLEEILAKEWTSR